MDKGGIRVSIITISNLHFSYDGSPESIFDGLSLMLDDNWRLGLIGRNGRGKTTLLKLLCGALDNGGAISSKIPFAYFPFPVREPNRDTISVLEGFCTAERWQIERELGLLSVSSEILDRPFQTLSNGERTKALLAALFLIEGIVPLIDEPTNHLDLEGRHKVGEYLSGKRGFILVSHDRNFLDSCVDHVLALNPEGTEILNGNFSTWNQERERREAFERAENQRLKSEVRRLGNAAQRAEKWSGKAEKGKHRTADSDGRPERGYAGHKAQKMMKRAKNIESRRTDAAEQKSKLLRNIEEAEPLKLYCEPYRSERLLSIQGANIFYGEREVVHNFDLEISRGERIALQGGNGSGKTSILKLLTDPEIQYTGDVQLGSGLKISYAPQDVSFLAGTLEEFAEKRALDRTLLNTILRKLGFSRAQLEADMRTFSDGQKKKAVLAASLTDRAHLYVWDEPLNYIDLFSRIQLEALILEAQPTLLFVEHDRAFEASVATRRILL